MSARQETVIVWKSEESILLLLCIAVNSCLVTCDYRQMESIDFLLCVERLVKFRLKIQNKKNTFSNNNNNSPPRCNDKWLRRLEIPCRHSVTLLVLTTHCFTVGYKSVFLQELDENDLDLKQSQSHTDTVPWSVSEWNPLEWVVLLFVFRGKPDQWKITDNITWYVYIAARNCLTQILVIIIFLAR